MRYFCYDEHKVNRVKAKLNTHDFQDMAQVFKVLADPTRLKVAYALCDEDELCVCDVANIIGSTMATASHHLRWRGTWVLRNIVKKENLFLFNGGCPIETNHPYRD